MVDKLNNFRIKSLFKYTGAFIVSSIVAYIFQLIWTLDKSINAYLAVIIFIITLYIYFYIVDIVIHIKKKFFSRGITKYNRNKRELYHQFVLNHFYHKPTIRYISDKKDIEKFNSFETGERPYEMSAKVYKNIDNFNRISKIAMIKTLAIGSGFLKRRSNKFRAEARYKKIGGKGNAIRHAYKILDKKFPPRLLKYYRIVLSRILMEVRLNKIMYDKQILKVINNKECNIPKEMPFNTSLNRVYYTDDNLRINTSPNRKHNYIQESKIGKNVNEKKCFSFRTLNYIINNIIYLLKFNKILIYIRLLMKKRNKSTIEQIPYIVLFIPFSILTYITMIIKALIEIYKSLFSPLRLMYYVYKHIKPIYEEYLPLTKEERLSFRDKLIIINSKKKISEIDQKYYILQRDRILDMLPKKHHSLSIVEDLKNDYTLLNMYIKSSTKFILRLAEKLAYLIVKTPRHLINKIPKLPKTINQTIRFITWYTYNYITIKIPYAIKFIISHNIKKIRKNHYIATKKIWLFRRKHPEIDIFILDLKINYHYYKLVLKSEINENYTKIKKNIIELKNKNITNEIKKHYKKKTKKLNKKLNKVPKIKHIKYEIKMAFRIFIYLCKEEYHKYKNKTK